MELWFEGWWGQGDCYQKWAGALLEKSKDMSNEELTIEVERKVQKRAEALYQCATDCYKMVSWASRMELVGRECDQPIGLDGDCLCLLQGRVGMECRNLGWTGLVCG